MRLYQDHTGKWHRHGLEAPGGELRATERLDIVVLHVPGATYAIGAHDRVYGPAFRVVLKITERVSDREAHVEPLAEFDAKAKTLTAIPQATR